MKFFWMFFAVFVFSSCTNQPKDDDSTSENANVENAKSNQVKIVFNEDSAYNYIQKQVDFGPRVPGSKEHLACHAYLVKHLKALADTMYLQEARTVTYDKVNIPVKNIIAEFNSKASKRILLCAHWDTRPFADQDTKDKSKPILGANDGASGVGVLMEVANKIKELNKPDLGIDIIFFDAEDWGDASGQSEHSFCLGAQYWVNNLHRQTYKADFGILLDMVGAPNALFGFESYSIQCASKYVSMVWSTAQASGYGQYFKNFDRGGIIDDHYYVYDGARIPIMNIIDYDPSTPNSFGKYWHTHNDNMDAIDRKTLKAVGQTVINVLSNY